MIYKNQNNQNPNGQKRDDLWLSKQSEDGHAVVGNVVPLFAEFVLFIGEIFILGFVLSVIQIFNTFQAFPWLKTLSNVAGTLSILIIAIILIRTGKHFKKLKDNKEKSKALQDLAALSAALIFLVGLLSIFPHLINFEPENKYIEPINQQEITNETIGKGSTNNDINKDCMISY